MFYEDMNPPMTARRLTMIALEWIGYFVGGAIMTVFAWCMLVFILTLDC